MHRGCGGSAVASVGAALPRRAFVGTWGALACAVRGTWGSACDRCGRLGAPHGSAKVRRLSFAALPLRGLALGASSRQSRCLGANFFLARWGRDG